MAAAKKTWTFESIQKAKKVATKTVPLVIDPEWGEAYGRAKKTAALAQTRLDKSPSDVALRAAAEEADEAVAVLEKDRSKKVVEFTFRALSGDEYDAVVTAHQPTAKQRAEANKSGGTLQWDPDTFPPALVAAALVEPELSDEEVAQLYASDQWNPAEVQQLFQGALRVCTMSFLAE